VKLDFLLPPRARRVREVRQKFERQIERQNFCTVECVCEPKYSIDLPLTWILSLTANDKAARNSYWRTVAIHTDRCPKCAHLGDGKADWISVEIA